MMHNMGHAITSYLGYIKGYEYIWQASFDADIKYIMTRALFESGMALSKKHGADLAEVLEYVEDLNVRFENKLLGDTILRVGRDTKRKLAEGDRLVAAYKTAKECGIVPAHIALGIAAGFLFAHPEDETALETSAYAKENGIAAALEKYSNITDASDVAVNEWGKRRLAYPINYVTEGYYVLVSYKSEPAFPAELDRVFGITEGVLRYMTTTKCEKAAKSEKAAPAAAEETVEVAEATEA